MARFLFGPGGCTYEYPDRTLVMGVINVTPDSFSDGGRFCDPEAAVRHGLRLVAEGADVLDIGGESTRPGAEPVDADREAARVLPVIQGVRAQTNIAISVDTSKADVARAALTSGATFVNDVTALRGDAQMARVVAEAGCSVVLMHMLGTPRTMQVNPTYADVVGDVCLFLRERMNYAQANGIELAQIWIDPGIGFGKSVEHNLRLLRELVSIVALGAPVVIGTSRKSFIGKILGTEVDGRMEGTAASVALAIREGAAMVRVHDVAQMVRVARVADAICGRLTAPQAGPILQPSPSV